MENRKGRIDTAYMILSGDDRPDRACKRIPTLIVILIVLGLTGAAASYFLPEKLKD